MAQMNWENEEHRIMVVKHFQKFGMLLTRINGNDKDDNSYKNPIEEWEASNQTTSFLETKDWKHSTGFGIRLGHNKYRAIDIDGVEAAPWNSFNYYESKDLFRFANEELVFNCLRLLGLPPTYEWIIKTPHGYHIIFKCEDIKDMPDSIAYAPNSLFSKDEGEQICLSRIELLWRTHLVMAPSMANKICYPDYMYYNCILPHAEPELISAGRIDDLLNYYCGKQGFADRLNAGYMTLKINGAKVFRTIIKDSICRDSFDMMYEDRHFMDGSLEPPTTQGTITYVDYTNDNLGRPVPITTQSSAPFIVPIIQEFRGLDSNRFWLESCATSETYNKLGILYSQQDPNKAWRYFHESGSELAYYNIACMMAMNKLSTNYISFSNCLKKSSSIEQIYKDKLRTLYYQTHEKRQDCLFFSLCTTAKKDEDLSSIEEVMEGFPKLIQISWAVTDYDGNVQKAHNIYIKPESYMIPLYVSKNGGLSHDLARCYGDFGYDGLISLLDAMSKCETIVGFDVLFCMKIIQDVIDNYHWDSSCVLPEEWKYVKKICLKKSSIGYMKKCYGIEKEPSLRDLYEYLTGCEYNRSKDAYYNVGCIMEIYSKLKENSCDFYIYSQAFPDDLPF